MPTRIHVNQHVIRANAKSGTRLPVLTVKTSAANTYAHEVQINGPCRIVYSPDKPLSCGARVWIEVENGVSVVPVLRSDTHDWELSGRCCRAHESRASL